MAARRQSWQRYIRIGGFLLVFMLFVPVFGIFLMQTVPLLLGPATIVVSQREKSMAVMTSGEDMTVSSPVMGNMRMDRAWRDDSSESIKNPVAISVTDRKISKSASLDLRAGSLDWTVTKIQEIVKNVGGYVENADIRQPLAGTRVAQLLVRVPTDRLNVTLDETKKVAAAVVGEHLNASDMTDRDVDITARLNAKQAEEAALIALLDEVTKMSDVIEVTQRLAIVRGEIERLQAEQRSLSGQVAMASVLINIVEDPRIAVDTNSVRDGNVVKQSVADVSRWGIALGSALVALLISGVPVLVIYGFVIWVAYRLGQFIARRLLGK